MYSPIHCTQQRMRELSEDRAAADRWPNWIEPQDRATVAARCPAELALWRAVKARHAAAPLSSDQKTRLRKPLAEAHAALVAAAAGIAQPTPLPPERRNSVISFGSDGPDSIAVNYGTLPPPE